MANYLAEIIWQRGEQKFLDKRYSRKHLVRFDGGLEIPASSSPHVVSLPYSDASAADPEEMMVAALSSCHMLFFLSFAAHERFCVDSYQDKAVGVMSANEKGKYFLSQVTLNPLVKFSGEHLPSVADIERLHQQSHEECYIANSVLAEVICKPVL